MTIHRKLLIWILCLTLTPMLTMGVFGYFSAEKSLRDEILKKLESITELKVKKIESFFSERAGDAYIMSNSIILRNYFTFYQNIPGQDQALTFEKIKNPVENLLKLYRVAYGYRDIMFINSRGLVIYSSNVNHDLIKSGDFIPALFADVFEKSKHSIGFSNVYRERAGKSTFLIIVAAPVLDAQAGFLGEVFLEADMKTVYDFIQDKTGLGNSGETLIAQKTKEGAFFLNPTFYDPDATLKQVPESGSGMPILKAIAGEIGSGISVDYNNDRVIAAWRPVHVLNWGLVSKMGVSEAFEPVGQLRNRILIMVLFSIGVCILIVTRLTANIIRPVLNLRHTAQHVNDGDFTARAVVTTRDEFGELAKTFNDMLDRLTSANAALRDAQMEILTLNGQLEQRVKQRTVELESANKELEAFSYSVSHDLRAPLRSIVGFAELLKSKITDKLDSQELHYLNVISESTNQMGHLIDDILSFSRMGRAEMMESLINFNSLVENAIKTLDNEIKGRTIIWKIQTLCEAKGDRSMMQLVMTNLLSNAIKFTKNRPDAEIEIGSRENDTETVYFIKDNGVGFDMRYSHKLFGLFQRLHRVDEFSGTGVGLANTFRIIQRHDGRIWADGKVNEGATFYFALPKKIM